MVESKYMRRRGVENVGFLIVIELYGDKSLGVFGVVLHGFGSEMRRIWFDDQERCESEGDI